MFTNTPGLLYILGAAIALAALWIIALGGEKKEASIVALLGAAMWTAGLVLKGFG